MQYSNFTILIILNLIIFFLFYNNFNRVSNFFNIYDIPTKRKIHKIDTPLVGGIIFISFFFTNLIFLTLLGDKEFFNFLAISNYKFYYFILLLFFSFFLIGFYDDKYNLKNSIKLMWITFFSALIIYSNYNFEILNLNFSFGLKFSLERFSILFTVICLISIITFMNLYDGTNIQSATFYLINFLLMFFVAGTEFILFLFIIPLIIFLFFNISGRCFLGDSGSNFLSCIFGIMLIRFYYNHDDIFADHILLMVFFPFIDAVRLFIKRILKNGLPFEADRNHIHHIMLSKYNYNKTIILLSIFPLIVFITILLKIKTIFAFLLLSVYYFLLIKN